jgi:hypothetical protein
MNEYLNELKAFVEAAGSQAAAARKLDITAAYLGDILKGNRTISDRMAEKLGFEWRIVRIEPFPHPENAQNVPVVTRTLARE